MKRASTGIGNGNGKGSQNGVSRGYGYRYGARVLGLCYVCVVKWLLQRRQAVRRQKPCGAMPGCRVELCEELSVHL